MANNTNRKSSFRGSIATTSSRYFVDVQATLAAAVGNNTAAFTGAIRGLISGTNLSKTKVTQAGVHGVFWLLGSNASTWPKAAVIGEVHAGVTARPDGAVLALLGAGGYTRAMFAVGSFDNDINGAQFGLDLSYNSVAGTKAMGYEADIRMSNNVLIMVGASSAPTNGVTGAGIAGPGSLFLMTGGTIKLYMNTNTLASPTWTAQT